MLPPGPSTPAIWQTLRYATDPRAYSRAVIERFGATTRFRALNGDGIVVADPELAREVFGMNADAFDVPPALADVFGAASVLANAGAEHRRQRKLLNGSFGPARLKVLAATVERVVGEHLEEQLRPALASGAAVRMTDLAQDLTLDVILGAVVGGRRFDRAEGRTVLKEVLASLAPAAIFSAILRTPLFPPWRRFLKKRAAFDAWVDRHIEGRRRDPADADDLLQALLESRYESGEPMSDAEIRDQLFTMLLAGHETTAIALAWGVYWMAREPAALARLREEQGGAAGSPPEAIARLPYLSAFARETLRIEPVVTDVARRCVKPVSLGAWTVPPGEGIVINICAIHGDPAVYPEPERFRPERFLERTFHAGEFIPFGGGTRRCLGAAFAEMELAIGLAAIARGWDLALADDRPERSVRRNITMAPERGVRVRVIGERAAAGA